jgi:hypothetical protein
LAKVYSRQSKQTSEIAAFLVVALVEAIKEGEDLQLEAGTHIFADTRDVVTQSVPS